MWKFFSRQIFLEDSHWVSSALLGLLRGCCSCALSPPSPRLTVRLLPQLFGIPSRMVYFLLQSALFARYLHLLDLFLQRGILALGVAVAGDGFRFLAIVADAVVRHQHVHEDLQIISILQNCSSRASSRRLASSHSSTADGIHIFRLILCRSLLHDRLDCFYPCEFDPLVLDRLRSFSFRYSALLSAAPPLLRSSSIIP